MSTPHTPNEDRGIVKNPNNPAHDADLENRRRQEQGSKPPPKESPPPAAKK